MSVVTDIIDIFYGASIMYDMRKEKEHKFQLRAIEKQENAIKRFSGRARFLWNCALFQKKETHENNAKHWKYCKLIESLKSLKREKETGKETEFWREVHQIPKYLNDNVLEMKEVGFAALSDDKSIWLLNSFQKHDKALAKHINNKSFRNLLSLGRVGDQLASVYVSGIIMSR